MPEEEEEEMLNEMEEVCGEEEVREDSTGLRRSTREVEGDRRASTTEEARSPSRAGEGADPLREDAGGSSEAVELSAREAGAFAGARALAAAVGRCAMISSSVPSAHYVLSDEEHSDQRRSRTEPRTL